MLRNEKYCGNALLQKKSAVNFLTKQAKKNEGEVPQFFVRGSHDPIIQSYDFDAVQAELERRNELGRPMGCASPFSAKIVCGDCGGWYGMAANRDQLIAGCRAAKAVLCDCAAIDAELAELQREIEVVTGFSRKAIHEIARNAAGREGLNERNNGCLERHCKATEPIRRRRRRPSVNGRAGPAFWKPTSVASPPAR